MVKLKLDPTTGQHGDIKVGITDFRGHPDLGGYFAVYATYTGSDVLNDPLGQTKEVRSKLRDEFTLFEPFIGNTTAINHDEMANRIATTTRRCNELAKERGWNLCVGELNINENSPVVEILRNEYDFNIVEGNQTSKEIGK